jgi:type II secretory ATPase GspE/PulE/Tfp pilus assembly ATPase PilB-like protein
MAQRLVRRLDDKTKQAYSPTDFEWRKINEAISTLPDNFPKPNLDGLQLYKAGKSEDNPFGYEGQLAIREQMTMTDNLRALLENPESKITAQSVEEAARQAGMLTMFQDGMLKVIAGQTSFEELARVVG